MFGLDRKIQIDGRCAELSQVSNGKSAINSAMDELFLAIA